LVQNGDISMINGSRGWLVSSHVLYVDDVMIIIKGSQRNLFALLNLFSKYAAICDQVINTQKSIFHGNIAYSRMTRITNFVGFSMDKLPFDYLGILIFLGNKDYSFIVHWRYNNNQDLFH